MAPPSTSTRDRRVARCGTHIRRLDEYTRLSPDYFPTDFNDLSTVIHGEWATFTERVVKMMPRNKFLSPVKTAQDAHDFGLKAMIKIGREIKSLAVDEKLHRNNFYRDPDHVYNPDVDSDPGLEGYQAMSLSADVEFYRSAISMGKRIEEQKRELRLLDLPEWYRPSRSTPLDSSIPPTQVMNPTDQVNLEAEFASELFAFDAYNAHYQEGQQTEEEKEEAIHLDGAAYRAMCLRTALESAPAAAAAPVPAPIPTAKTGMEPQTPTRPAME